MSASWRETALNFACDGIPLVGVLCAPAPDAPPAELGVLIVVGGPQYRAGSHRQFVLLSRALAQAGHAALRFDYRGMGDSSGAVRSYAEIDADIAAALDALLGAAPSIRRVVLWGLCDGASAALLYAQRRGDTRVAGLVLANPWLAGAQAEAHAIVHTYYRQRFLDPAFWRKLLGGGINPLHKWQEWRAYRRKARGDATDAGDAAGAALLAALETLSLPMLMLLSRRDATAQTFLAQLDLAGSKVLERSTVRRQTFEEADHTFSRAAWRKEVENVTIAWLNDAILRESSAHTNSMHESVQSEQKT